MISNPTKTPANDQLPATPRTDAVGAIHAAFLESALDRHNVLEAMSASTEAGKALAVLSRTLERELIAAQARIAELERAKDGAYLERNQCVALIAKMALAMGCRAGLAVTAIEGWSADWNGCVYIDLPSGQVSWHFHDTQAYLFDGLPHYEGKWDGHDTQEKYRRVGYPELERALATSRAVVIEECAKVCEWIAETYDKRERLKYPELKTDAATGVSDCTYAIRALLATPTIPNTPDVVLESAACAQHRSSGDMANAGSIPAVGSTPTSEGAERAA